MSIDGGVTFSPTLTSSQFVAIEIRPQIIKKVRPGVRRIHRVPLNLRLKKQNDQYVYDPMMISLGPYHHGEPHLRQMEEFKHEALKHILLNSDTDKSFYYNKIFERIDEIRSCYVGVTKDEYDDVTLSEMILLDTCFIIYYMKADSEDEETIEHIREHIGALAFALLLTDLFMLENQIPYWVIKFLTKLRFGENIMKLFFRRHIGVTGLGELDLPSRIPWLEDEEGGEEEPAHLLECYHRILSSQTIVFVEKSVRPSVGISRWMLKMKKKMKKNYDGLPAISRTNDSGFQFYSVTDLKSKGIHFGPSSTCWTDVRFKSNAFYGEIQIPMLYISPSTQVFLHNVIAFETSPGPFRGFSGTSFVNFMKPLIVNSKDVRELREKGILFHCLGSDDEVVKVFQGIDTLGFEIDLVEDVKMRITEHCNSKAKTWMAELVNTKLKSPWTAIALLAATFLLVLTFLQTYYTIHAA